MVGTIPERRDKWCLDNGGVTVSLQDDGDGPYVPDGQPVTTETLVAIPDQTMQDYLDDLALEEDLSVANEELLILTEANAELAYWVDKTPQDVTDIITAAPNTFVSFKQMIEKNAQSVRVMAILLKLLRDTGRLG